MSRTAEGGDAVRDLLSVAGLLEEPELARLYTYLHRDGPATVQEAMDATDLPQGTAYGYVNRLEEAGLVEAVSEDQPREYTAVDIELSLSTGQGDREYTVTPMLVDAVSRRSMDDDIDAYVDRHGIDGLATGLTYAVARERGETTHRLMARDLDISALEAEVILGALRSVVHDHLDVDQSGASLDAVVEAENLDVDDAGE
jgi:DNA-binding transcriptional ArsR family regulator